MLTGCYHASITTGLPESSTEVYDTPWAMGFIAGLIPPAEIDASEKCQNGVAKVETKLSFLNQIVGGITFGIVTPMHITVTCAADSKGSLETNIPKEQIITVPADVSKSDIQQIYKYASDLAVMYEKPIYVQH
jgi:hypothetical protein